MTALIPAGYAPATKAQMLILPLGSMFTVADDWQPSSEVGRAGSASAYICPIIALQLPPQTSRQEFETWWKTDAHPSFTNVESAFVVWQAARGITP